MTEQEARTKQCWHKYIMCIASDCMKWPECKYWWERPTIEQIKADYDDQARKTAQIIVKEFEAKLGGTP
jgi:hypothetical protein